MSLSTRVYERGTGEFNDGDNPAIDLHLIQGGVEILLVAFATETRISSGLMGHFVFVCRLRLTITSCLAYFPF